VKKEIRKSRLVFLLLLSFVYRSKLQGMAHLCADGRTMLVGGPGAAQPAHEAAEAERRLEQALAVLGMRPKELRDSQGAVGKTGVGVVVKCANDGESALGGGAFTDGP
jgi:hypothetical protein